MKKFTIVLFSILFSTGLIAQNTDSLLISLGIGDELPKEDKFFFKSFFEDGKALLLSPKNIVTIKKAEFWAPVMAATIFAVSRDEAIYKDFKDYQTKHSWVDKLSPVITFGGDNRTVLGISGLFYLGGLALKNEKAKQTGIMCIEALGHAGILVTAGKFLTGRQRPSYDGTDQWHWFPSSFKVFDHEPQSKYDAFPSGHTIAAWSIASVIATQYSDHWIVPAIAYTFATSVGLSRLTEDAHWISDVIVGGALGYTIGRFIANKHKGTKWKLFRRVDTEIR